MKDLTIHVEYEFGEELRIRGTGDIAGICTGYYIADAGHLRYELVWFYNGKAESRYFFAFELERVAGQGR